MLLRVFCVAPAIHRAAGDSFEDHDFARSGSGEGREDKIFADAGDEIEADCGVWLTKAHSRYVRERENALRSAIRGTRCIRLEKRSKRAFADCDDYQVVAARVGFEIRDLRFLY